MAHIFIVIPGILFHAGIALMLYIPFISVGSIVFYSLFIPDSFWQYLKRKLQSQDTIYVKVDETNMYILRLWRVLKGGDFRGKYIASDKSDAVQFTQYEHFLQLLSTYTIYLPIVWLLSLHPVKLLLKYSANEWLNISVNNLPRSLISYRFKQMVLVYFTLICLAMQAVVSVYRYKSFRKSIEQGNRYEKVNRRQEYDLSRKNWFRIFLGINGRGLFLDHGQHGAKYAYAITYFNKGGEEIWLPMYTEQGYIAKGMNISWAKFPFHLLAFSAKPENSAGLKKLTKFWADKAHVSLDSLHMTIYKKTYIYPTHFEKDYYKKLESQPWEKEGEIWWRDSVFSYHPFK